MAAGARRAAAAPDTARASPSRTLDRPVRVACVGHASLDHVFTVEHLPHHPGKTLASGYVAQGGGMSFNAAIAAARLGASVRLVACVGDDDAADVLRAALHAEGVDAAALTPVAGRRTSVSAIVVDGHGERQIVTHRGDALASAPPLDLRWLEGADVVMVDPRWPQGAMTALRWARQAGVMSILDADVAPREDLQRLVPMATWAVFSAPGWAVYAPGRSVRHGLAGIASKGCDMGVVTEGERGAWWSRGGAAAHVPAWPVTALDTTAAGDVFHAALAVALAEGQDAMAALSWASAAAAYKCERGRGAFGSPTQQALQRWLRGRPAPAPTPKRRGRP